MMIPTTLHFPHLFGGLTRTMIPPAVSLCRLHLFSLPHSLCFSLSLSQELGNLIEEPFSILPLEAMGDGIESSIYEALERDCGLELGQVQTAPYGIWPIFRIVHIHMHQTLSRLVHPSCESRNGNLTALTEYVSLMQDCEMVDYRSVSSKPSSFVR